MSKQIVLITTGQPSSNPRIVKEAISLSEIGYEVTVIYNFWVSWALNYDKKIFIHVVVNNYDVYIAVFFKNFQS